MDNIKKQISTAIKDLGVALYDVVPLKENQQDIIRVYIVSKDGVTLDKCVEVTRVISPLLDVYEPMSGKYNLEVSTPGIERKLKTLEHFEYSIDELVKIKDIHNNKISGKIIALEEGIIILEVKNIKRKIPFDEIVSAKTYFKWDK